MSDQLPSIIGCGLLATDKGLTLRGLGCVHDNDNAVLTRLDFRSRSLRRDEQCWFHIPAGYRGQQVWMVGFAFTGVKDYVNRDGVAGAFAVITEAAFARDGYAEGVFLSRALVRAMHERMIDKATMRARISPAAEVLQIAGRELARAPKDPPVDVDMEAAAIDVSVARNWTAEITPDALMLMVRNQRQTFEPLLSAGYVLRENIGDRTQWAIDADFYRRFYYREIFQKNKSLIESNSRLQEEVGREQVRYSRLKSDYDKKSDDYDKKNSEVNELNRRVVALDKSLSSVTRDKGDLENKKEQLEGELQKLSITWKAGQEQKQALEIEVKTLKRANESLQLQPSAERVKKLKILISRLRKQIGQLKEEGGQWQKRAEYFEEENERLRTAGEGQFEDVDSENPLQRVFAIGVIIIAAIIVVYFWSAVIALDIEIGPINNKIAGGEGG